VLGCWAMGDVASAGQATVAGSHHQTQQSMPESSFSGAPWAQIWPRSTGKIERVEQLDSLNATGRSSSGESTTSPFFESMEPECGPL
jgi:hypothetical protein